MPGENLLKRKKVEIKRAILEIVEVTEVTADTSRT